jgi:hypothetical protein
MGGMRLGVYGAMRAPPTGFMASMKSPIPPSSHDANNNFEDVE